MTKEKRLEEYEQLLKELEQTVPELESSLDRAVRRKKHKTYIYRPLASLAASFVLFIFLVNVSVTVAQACSKIPILKELAEAVTFSKSLSDAVEHAYVQEINLTQSNEEVSVSIEYLIVDQKQINIFYKLDSSIHNFIYGEPELLNAQNGEKLPCSVYWNRGNDETSGKLQQITADFGDTDVPNGIKLQLSIMHYPNMEIEDRESDSEIFEIEEVIGEFEFTLSFDPTFTDAGKQIPVNQTVILDEQKITVTNIEIYPSHIRINVEDNPSNTAWLTGLDYQLLIDDSKAFDPIMGGISATGAIDSPAMVSFRTDSSYFYDADQLTLRITGASWLEKDREKAYVNLETGEVHNLPEDITLYEIAEKEGNPWVSIQVPFIKEDHYHQVLLQTFYDKKGNEYTSSRFGTDGALEKESFFIVRLKQINLVPLFFTAHLVQVRLL